MREQLIATLTTIVGKRHVLTDPRQTRAYRTGIRFGQGKALAVVRPGSLVEQWRVLKACMHANVIVLSQAANTGLTGGSTPDGDAYDRDVVIVSMTRMQTVHLLQQGKQVLCLPGATLDQLERTLAPLGREPHSVIGSSCIGASVIGGVCNNSGGALVRRGPAYTELALYARVDEQGRVALVNHLGIHLGGDEEAILAAVQQGAFAAADVAANPGAAHDHLYAEHVRQVDADTPARYNADPARLYEASGSAGKLMVFAVRLDTFPIERDPVVFYIGTPDINELTDVRRRALRSFGELPIAGEYLHRDAFAIAHRYGKDTFLMIQHLGTRRLPALFGLKARFDALCEKLPFLPPDLSDRLLQFASRCFPEHLPQRMHDFHARYPHHLMLKVSARSADETRHFLDSYFEHAQGAWFECTPKEGAQAFLHRYVTAGAANRYRALHRDTVEDILALDIALPRNARQWFETLPPEIGQGMLLKLYYGHFLCHVFHQDYIVRKGYDPIALEHQMWALLDARGAEYPAEHNVGHLYPAKPPLREHYQRLDPCNCLNAGIGQMSKRSFYREPGRDG
jgi:D-lactate dehydrogenase